MSFTGEIETKCPNGCEPFTTQVWSFIRGETSPELRTAALAREVNLLICPACNAPFFPDAAYIYFEPEAEILAFVFPESFKDREEFWRAKMMDDLKTMKEGLGPDLFGGIEPELFFGPEGLGALLEAEDWKNDEREVMEAVAKELGLPLYRVSPQFARFHGIPASLPYIAQKGKHADKKSLIEGLTQLIQANDRLETYAKYLEALKTSPELTLPPAAKLMSSASKGLS
jgi:hypothetical protein